MHINNKNIINYEYYKKMKINYLKKCNYYYYIQLNKHNLLEDNIKKYANNALIMYHTLLRYCNNSDYSNNLVLKQIICQK